MIKLDLVTGFLGAGKTTFIIEYVKQLSGRGKRVAVVVNDHGAINVDRMLLEEAVGGLCHIEMVELDVAEGTEIEGCKIVLVEAQHIAVLIAGIFPLLQVDVGLGLLKLQGDVLGVQADGLDKG